MIHKYKMKLCIQKWCIFLLSFLCWCSMYCYEFPFLIDIDVMLFSVFFLVGAVGAALLSTRADTFRSLASARALNETWLHANESKLFTLNQNDSFYSLLPSTHDMTIRCVFLSTRFSISGFFSQCVDVAAIDDIPIINLQCLTTTFNNHLSDDGIHRRSDILIFQHPLKAFPFNPCNVATALIIVVVHFKHRTFHSTCHHYCHNFSVCSQIFRSLFVVVVVLICSEDWHICLSPMSLYACYARFIFHPIR